MMTPAQVQKMTGETVKPIANMKMSELPEDAQMTLTKYPQLKKYGYLRYLAGQWIFKVALGTTGKDIK
jgi:hypothetical protein